MKIDLKYNQLPLFALLCGGLGALLRLWLYGTGLDEEGLLTAAHPAGILVLILTALTIVALLWFLRHFSTQGKYSRQFPASVLGSMGSFAGAAGILLAALLELIRRESALSVLTGLLGVAAAVAMVMTGLCRFKGMRPNFLFHTVICLFFVVWLISRYQSWSADPQLHDYCFQLLATVCAMLFGYHRAALDLKSGNRRPLYSSDGRELEGTDRRDEYADRYALSDTEIADRAGNQRGTHLVYGTADRDTDRVRRELPGTDRTVHRNDGTDGNSIYREDEYGNREYVFTGWESERELFTESLFGTGNGENLADPDGGADHLGTDTAYLFADLTNIIDEDAPVEDCTTMRQPQHRKKNNGPVMGGM